MALVKSTFLEKLGGVVVVLFPEEPVVSIVVVLVSKSTLPLNIVSTELKFSADKRETFLTLKNVALKQHDQIKALEFHTQDYQSHYVKLNWNGQHF
jgi:hypothetical protein